MYWVRTLPTYQSSHVLKEKWPSLCSHQLLLALQSLSPLSAGILTLTVLWEACKESFELWAHVCDSHVMFKGQPFTAFLRNLQLLKFSQSPHQKSSVTPGRQGGNWYRCCLWLGTHGHALPTVWTFLRHHWPLPSAITSFYDQGWKQQSTDISINT